MSPSARRTVAVRVLARDLDTDSKSEGRFTVPVPLDAAQELDRLRGLVQASHPQAELRSFADHVATFVDSSHLIVAAFDAEELRGRRKDTVAAARAGQDELFAA